MAPSGGYMVVRKVTLVLGLQLLAGECTPPRYLPTFCLPRPWCQTRVHADGFVSGLLFSVGRWWPC